MHAKKKLLIIKASSDLCATEIAHIRTIAELIDIEVEVFDLCKPETFSSDMSGKGKYDYVYLASHASMEGFGEPDGSKMTDWAVFGDALRVADCLRDGSILLLACCRGGLKYVALLLFESCPHVDYVCGPRWVVTGLDLTAGFHVFVYNMEVRREQPSCSAERASKATGFDFFCYDRVELEDNYKAQLEGYGS